MLPRTIYLGENEGKPHIRIEIEGFEHPDTVEPHGMDLLRCTVHAVAPPVNAPFEVSMRVEEFFAKAKLGQNRSAVDQARIAKETGLGPALGG